MAELICGLDVETTGLDASSNHIIEIGAALLDPYTWEVLDRFSTFVNNPKALPLDNHIVELTGITEDNLKTGLPPMAATAAFLSFAKKATVFLAHNASFDKAFMEKAFEAVGHKDERPWYCSKTDVSHTGKNCTKLSHLALDYGLQVDGAKLHRALDDVLLMAALMQKIGKPFHEIKAYAEEPWVYIHAKVSYDDRDLAKKAGFSWEKCMGTTEPVFTKKWVKRVKKSAVDAEVSSYNFKHDLISPRGY